MTVYLKGHNYKYEMENIVRMFFPLQRFEYRLDELPQESQESEDSLVILAENGVPERLTVTLREGETVIEKTASFTLDDSEANHRERELGKLLYRVLEQHTGVSPEWGIITGVRPVKLFEQKMEEGFSEEETKQYFLNQWYVSPQKADLSLMVARSQKGILESNHTNDFSLYLSIPYCPTRCSYCSFVSQAVSSKKVIETIPEYLEYLVKEIYFTADIAKENGLNLKTVYIGGGTPTTLSADQLRILLSAVTKAFPETAGLEFTVEAGRPDTITKEKLLALKEFGVGRISINPQTFSDEVLAAIGRKHSAAETVAAFELAREVEFDSINMDLIAGLPKDTPESFCRTLEQALSLSPENLTVHTLTVKRSSALYEQVKAINETYSVLQMTKDAQRELLNHGYLPYYLYRQKNTVGNLENVGYSKPGHFCGYNVYIMEEVQTILALGAGAVTKLVGKDGSIHRIYNYKYPAEYISGFENILDRKRSVTDFFRGENL